MSILRLVLINVMAVGAALSMAACSMSSPPSTLQPVSAQKPASDDAEWTVLIYQHADHNLEAAALADLEEMASIGSTNRVHVVVQTDRRLDEAVNQGVLNLPDWTTAKRLYVEKDGLKELDDLGEVNSDDPQVLKEFITWGKRTYPAKRYALVLWDHGGAFLGFGGDETAGTGSIMRLPALAGALKEADLKFDFLGFDACLMANAEVAFELQPFARVLGASEELEPGPGWDYTAVLGALEEDPGMDGLKLGKVVADSYVAYYEKHSPSEALYVTFSLLDLREMPKVASALAAFGDELNRYIMTDSQGRPSEQLARLGKVMGQARYETPGFFRSDFASPGLVFDAGLLADHAAKFTGDAGITQSAADLKAALTRAIPYSLAGEGFKGTKLSGLSLHLPVYTTDFRVTEPYSQLTEIQQTRWSKHLTAFSQVANQDKRPPLVAQPQIDAPAVVPGRNRATVKGSVSDETLVTGVVVGVTGIIGEQSVLFGLEEQPRTYQATNSYLYTLDGMTWYLDDGQSPQPVFAVQWRPGQRAVFGLYQESPDYEPLQAYFVYDEVSGRLVQGFDTSGNWIGAIAPGADSVFLPFLLTPDLEVLEINEPVLVRGTTLKKAPLPSGEYVITVTGFDLGNNADTGAVLVTVVGDPAMPGPQTCLPNDVDAASTLEEHNARFELESLGVLDLALLVDRTQVGQVRYDLHVQGGDQKVMLQMVGPDGQPVGASGEVNNSAYDYFSPQLSGLYQLRIADETGGPKRLFLTWSLSQRQGLGTPDLIDLDRNPNLVDLFEQQGHHVGRLTVPAGQALSLSLNFDQALTPWVGYTISVPEGSGSLPMVVLSPDEELLDESVLCGSHMGGFPVTKSGEYAFLFDNRDSAQDQVTLFILEAYHSDSSPAAALTTLNLSDWCTGDHSEDFTVPAGQGLQLLIPCDSTQASQVAFNLTRVVGQSTLDYAIMDPDGSVLLNGTHQHIAQEKFTISTTGIYALTLDNTASLSSKTIKLTVSVQGRIEAPAAVSVPTPTPALGSSPTNTHTPSVLPASTPTPTPIPEPIAYQLPEFAAGDNSRDFTVGPRQTIRLVIPFDSTLSASAGVALSQGGGVIRYQIEGPNGQLLASDTFGYISQETVSIDSSGSYIIQLENTSTSGRTVRLAVTVRGR